MQRYMYEDADGWVMVNGCQMQRYMDKDAKGVVDNARLSSAAEMLFSFSRTVL